MPGKMQGDTRCDTGHAWMYWLPADADCPHKDGARCEEDPAAPHYARTGSCAAAAGVVHGAGCSGANR